MNETRDKFCEKNIRNRFDEMIKLSEAVHRAIIVGLGCNLDKHSYLVNKMIRINRDANPLDFIRFHAWAMGRGYSEEEIRKKYKEIANKVLDDGGSVLTCFKELLLFSESLVVQLAINGCEFHNYHIFSDNDHEWSSSDSD